LLTRASTQSQCDTEKQITSDKLHFIHRESQTSHEDEHISSTERMKLARDRVKNWSTNNPPVTVFAPEITVKNYDTEEMSISSQVLLPLHVNCDD